MPTARLGRREPCVLVVHQGWLAHRDADRAALRTPRWRAEPVPALATAGIRGSLNLAMVLLLAQGNHVDVLLNVRVLLRSSHAVGPRQTLDVAKVDLTKIGKLHSLGRPTLVTPKKVEGEASAFCYRESSPAVLASCPCFVAHSHFPPSTLLSAPSSVWSCRSRCSKHLPGERKPLPQENSRTRSLASAPGGIEQHKVNPVQL